jgi:hypothetical protein
MVFVKILSLKPLVKVVLLQNIIHYNYEEYVGS